MGEGALGGGAASGAGARGGRRGNGDAGRAGGQAGRAPRTCEGDSDVSISFWIGHVGRAR